MIIMGLKHRLFYLNLSHSLNRYSYVSPMYKGSGPRLGG